MQVHDAKHRIHTRRRQGQPTSVQEPMYKTVHISSSQSCANVHYGFQKFVSFCELEKDLVIQTNLLKMHLPARELFLSMTLSVTNLQPPPTGAIQASSIRGHQLLRHSH